MKINIITRCTRLSNLKVIRESVKNNKTNIDVDWHIMFDTNVLKDIDAELLHELTDDNTFFHFEKGDSVGYGYPQLNNVIQKIKKGFIYHLDDDNVLHSNFYSTLQSVYELHFDNKPLVYIFSQQVDGKDFSKLDVRIGKPENVAVSKIDLAQWMIDVSLHNEMGYYYGSGYKADGFFIESLYKEIPDKFYFIDEVLCNYNYLTSDPKPKVPKVLFIGENEPILKSIQPHNYEATELNVKYLKNDSDINEVLVNFYPDAILTQGVKWEDFTEMAKLPLFFRNRWLHVENDKKEEEIGQIAYNLAMSHMLCDKNIEDPDLISFITPIYNTKEKLYNTYKSLQNQTYNNWEWVLINDSTDGGKTLKIAEEISKKDPRVIVYDFRNKSNGNIGEVKYRGFMLAKGFILAELDHDDLLVPWCAEDLYKAAKKHPECGFFFGDTAEVNEAWESMTYGEGFALGYGSYRDEDYFGTNLKVANQQNINPKTIRHIVGVPNHIRAWRRKTYLEIGGHNRGLTIADDYELLVRTFLNTIFCKIPKLSYIQFIYNNETGRNTHDLSRADIQRRVATIANHYNEKIKKRFEELGLIDWAYEENKHFPLYTNSRFGDDEQVANITYTEI